jgi:hypothetical protein
MAEKTPDPKDIRALARELLAAEESTSKMVRDFQEMRDFAKEVANGFLNARSAQKLHGVIQDVARQVKESADMMVVFQSRSMSARFAFNEIASGAEINAKRMRFLNEEMEKFSALERVTAKDSSLATSLIKTLTDGLGQSQQKLLDAKTAMLNVDARYLEQQREAWANSTQNLQQLQAQASEDKKSVAVEEKRLEILERRRILEEDYSKAAAKRMGKEKRALLDAERLTDLAKLEAEYRATGGGATMYEAGELKSLARMQAGVQRERDESNQRMLAATIILAEEEEKQGKKDLLGLKSRAGYLQHIQRGEETNLGVLGEQYKSITGFVNKAKLIPPQFMLFDALLRFGVERFIALDKAAEDFRKLTGFSINQMKELRKDAEAVNAEFAGMGVSIEAAYKSAKALTDIFGRTSLVSKEALKNAALLSANLGVAEESTANVLANFQGLGGATEQAAMNVIKVGAGISEKAGVPFKLVMQDVANASETTLNMLGANPSKLMKSAIAARAMGMELNKMVESQRKMLDFSSSINDELNASALLGKNINFQLARQYAFEGRVEDSARATLETVKRAGDFNKMNVYQREALAKAAGMELKDLTKMMAVDAQRETIMNGTDETKKSILRAQEAELKKLKEKEKLDSDDLVKQNEKVLMQQKMQGIMTNINNLLDAMKLAFAEILEPVITPLAKILVPLLKVAAFILKGLLLPLKGIGWLLGQAADLVEGWVSGLGEVGEVMKKILTGILAVAGFGIMTAWLVGKGGFSGLWNNIGETFTRMKDGAANVGKSIKSAFSKVTDKLFGDKGAAAGGLKQDKAGRLRDASGKFVKKPVTDTVSASKESETVKPNSGEGLKTFLKNLAEGLKAMKGADVLFGALNLIPASLGLVVMIPGFFGAKLLERLDGEKIKAGLEGLSSGIKSMASADVLLGAGALMLTSLALVIMIPGLIAMAGIAFLGVPFSAGLTAMSAGLSALGGNPLAWLGIAAIGALSLAFLGFALGIKLIAEGLSTVVNSFTVFADLDWSTIAKGLVTMLGLGIVATTLGAALPLILGGAIAIGVLGVAMIGFGAAIEVARPGLESLAGLLDKFAQIGGDGLLTTAFGITALAGALAAFGAGSAAAGLGSFAGKLLGGDPIKRLQRFIDIGPKLKESAESIDKIASATAKFGMIDAFATAVDRLVYSLEKLNDQLDKTSTIKVAALSTIAAITQKGTETTTAPATETTGVGLEAKMDELITLLRDGAISIDLDGERVSRAMAARGRE